MKKRVVKCPIGSRSGDGNRDRGVRRAWGVNEEGTGTKRAGMTNCITKNLGEKRSGANRAGHGTERVE